MGLENYQFWMITEIACIEINNRNKFLIRNNNLSSQIHIRNETLHINLIIQ